MACITARSAFVIPYVGCGGEGGARGVCATKPMADGWWLRWEHIDVKLCASVEARKQMAPERKRWANGVKEQVRGVCVD